MLVTINVEVLDKQRMDAIKLHPREPYGEVLARLLDMAEAKGTARKGSGRHEPS